MPKPTSARPATTGPLVALLAYDGLCTFEFGVAWEAFGLPRPELGPGWYRCRTIAMERGNLAAAGGLAVAAPFNLKAVSAAKLVVAPGWRGIDAAVPAPAVKALVAAHDGGARLASLCSGAFVLAATGLLDGRRATTHWRYADALAQKYPAISVEPEVLYIDNGDLLTAAGSAAGIDLCLHIIRGDFGHESANTVARRMVVAPHREGGQAQFIRLPVPNSHEGERLGHVLQAVQSDLAAAHSILSMANMAGMSARTFQRRFQDMTGQAPGEWLVNARLARACHLLETRPELPLEQLAAAVGFGSAVTLRHHFRNRFKLSPRDWRNHFSSEDSGEIEV